VYPIKILQGFDMFLESRNLNFNAIIIGGAALSILGVISRQTQDVDVLDPEIPDHILEAARDFAKSAQYKSCNLKNNWLNHEVCSLRDYLRPNWKNRIVPLYIGKCMNIYTLGRLDLIGTKVLAFCDRGFDLQDCVDLKITKTELFEILSWVKNYDAHPSWPSYVDSQVKILSRKLGYEL